MAFLQPSYVREHRTTRIEIHVLESPPELLFRSMCDACYIEFEPRPARGHVTVISYEYHLDGLDEILKVMVNFRGRSFSSRPQ